MSLLQQKFDSREEWTNLERANSDMVDTNDLIYLRARYYDPVLGRFPNLDPIEGTMEQPQSLNRYVYADDNPVNNTDPTGMSVCSDLTSSVGELIGCFSKVLDLYNNFGITLAEEYVPSPAAKQNWISPRVNNVYEAVQAINRRLGGLTKQAIGGTQMLLSPTSPGPEAAVTSLCNRIRLYRTFTDGGTQYTNHVHSTNNIIHEFGHVITLSPPLGRSANSTGPAGPAVEMANRPVALWEQIQTLRGLSEGAGWGDATLREHPTNVGAEQVADMFLFWVQGYAFTPDTIGQARDVFIKGGTIPDRLGNPLPRSNDHTAINDGSVVTSAGITAWAGNTSCPGAASANAGDSALANDPYLMAANAGWCGFA